MKKRFKVTWAGPARFDLIEIASFIARDSPAAVLRAIRTIREKIAKLTVSPQRARLVPELSKQGISRFRELIIPPWRVLFRIEENEVFILMVVDSRRNLEDILFMRLLR